MYKRLNFFRQIIEYWFCFQTQLQKIWFSDHFHGILWNNFWMPLNLVSRSTGYLFLKNLFRISFPQKKNRPWILKAINKKSTAVYYKSQCRNSTIFCHSKMVILILLMFWILDLDKFLSETNDIQNQRIEDCLEWI